MVFWFHSVLGEYRLVCAFSTNFYHKCSKWVVPGAGTGESFQQYPDFLAGLLVGSEQARMRGMGEGGVGWQMRKEWRWKFEFHSALLYDVYYFKLFSNKTVYNISYYRPTISPVIVTIIESWSQQQLWRRLSRVFSSQCSQQTDHQTFKHFATKPAWFVLWCLLPSHS